MARSPVASLGQALLGAGATDFVFAPWDFREGALERDMEALPEGAWVELPPCLPKNEVERLIRLLDGRGLSGVVLGSVGQLGYDFPLPIAFGPGVPITNRLAYEGLSRYGARFFTIWPELRHDEAAELLPLDFPGYLMVYGRQRVMLLSHCPLRVARGLSSGRGSCRLCDAGEGISGSELTDRKGFRFPMSRTRYEGGCEVSVLGALPTVLDKYRDKRLSLGAGSLLSFTTEPPERQIRITRYFAGRGDCGFEQATAGHFLRGVE